MTKQSTRGIAVSHGHLDMCMGHGWLAELTLSTWLVPPSKTAKTACRKCGLCAWLKTWDSLFYCHVKTIHCKITLRLWIYIRRRNDKVNVVWRVQRSGFSAPCHGKAIQVTCHKYIPVKIIFHIILRHFLPRTVTHLKNYRYLHITLHYTHCRICSTSALTAIHLVWVFGQSTPRVWSVVTS